MKNIKELGLELIELKDQILLVEKINGTCGKWILVDWDEYGYFVDTTEHDRDYGGKDKNVIASTVQLQGLPLLVIEDEAMSNALNLIEESKIETESTKLILIGAYTTGYNKAKETYKFTEEDLIKAIDMAQEMKFIPFTDNEMEHEFQSDEIIQSLTKKELLIEVEYQDMMGMWISSPTILEHCDRPTRVKITNNQIKAVWK